MFQIHSLRSGTTVVAAAIVVVASQFSPELPQTVGGKVPAHVLPAGGRGGGGGIHSKKQEQQLERRWREYTGREMKQGGWMGGKKKTE